MPNLRFGDFELDPAQRLLRQAGQPLKLGGRGFDLLLALVERRDRLVGKNELLDLVWPGLVVEENNLQVQVTTLRKLLGPQAIATVPGRGYRFALPLEASAEPTATAAPSPGATELATRLPMAAPPPTNLPARLPELIGRASDVQAVRALVATQSLVAIVGAGGIGKTRLALAVAATLTDDFADGVWWVELGALSDPQMVPNAVAQVLGVGRSSDAPLPDTLVTVLRDQRLLLVLDNAEHLLDAVAVLTDTLLRACPGVRVLLTSQEPTRLRDEHSYRLASLAVPAADQPVDPHGGAAALFVARAQAADRLLRFDAASLVSVAAICRALDGIPLAIELAAARVPLLGVEGLRERLHERLNVLTGGSRLVLRRHQTLRAALDWSHALLSEDERIVFRRLAVFAGGFSLPLAQAVAADERIGVWAVLDLLGHLVDKSLVAIDLQDSQAGPRYRLLETARAYALEQLAAAGETQSLLRRHAQALFELLQDLYPTRWTHDAVTIARANVELDNLRAALDWAAAPGGDLVLGHALHGVAHMVWHRLGLLLEGIERYLRLPLATLPPRLEARAQLAHARLGYLGARLDCYRAAERAAALFEALGDDSDRFDALCTLVMIGSRRDERAAVTAALRVIDRLVQPHWPPRQRATAALAHAMACLMLGDAAGAVAAARRQHACYAEDEHNRLGCLLAAGNAAYYEALLGNHAAAIARLERLVVEFDQLPGPARGSGIYRGYLAMAYFARNGPGDLRRSIETARDCWQQLRREQNGNWLLITLALAQARRSAPANAVRLLGYVEAQRAAEGSVVRVWDQRQHDEVHAMREQIGAAQFDAWYATGGQLEEHGATELAFALD